MQKVIHIRKFSSKHIHLLLAHIFSLISFWLLKFGNALETGKQSVKLEPVVCSVVGVELYIWLVCVTADQCTLEQG